MLRLERLDEHAIAAHFLGFRLVHRLERAGEEEHGDVLEVGVSLDERRNLVAASLRHADIGENDVRTIRRNARNRLFAVTDSDHLHVLTRKGELDHPLNRDAVVGQQQLVHKTSPEAESWQVKQVSAPRLRSCLRRGRRSGRASS